jgi:hypothetical protein
MKPTKELVDAIQNYYFNRYRAEQGIAKWNKNADLDRISNATKLRMTACAGTFWFEHITDSHVICYETNERLFPEFKKTKEVRRKK